MLTIVNISKENRFYDLSELPDKIKNGKPVNNYIVSVLNNQILDAATDDFSAWSVNSDSDIILGCDTPRQFREIITQWNDDIKSYAVQMVTKWAGKGFPFGPHELSLINAHAALKEADDEFDVDGQHCVVGFSGDFHTCLTRGEMMEMLEEPERFAVIDVIFKYND